MLWYRSLKQESLNGKTNNNRGNHNWTAGAYALLCDKKPLPVVNTQRNDLYMDGGSEPI